MTTLGDDLMAALGAQGLRQGAEMAAFCGDWTGKYTAAPLAVARPATTAEVSKPCASPPATGWPWCPQAGAPGWWVAA